MSCICPPLAYCTNIHPGESWEEILLSLQTHLPRVRGAWGIETEYFPIGLRLSALAANELAGDESARRQFADWMEENKFEVFTINGFPYGAFHGVRVKENVFLPDWSSPERLDYTKKLFSLLNEWARPGRDISVSTLPGSHKSFRRQDRDLIGPVRELGRFLEEMHGETGRDAHLGFEPEPFGQFDNADETIGFLNKVFQSQADEERLRLRLGVTFDTCHFALQYEPPAETLRRFEREGIRISKVQASNALALDPRDSGALAALAEFEEPVYFHQVVVQGISRGERRVFPDLIDALDWTKSTGETGTEWRCHFHIPIGAAPEPPLRDTNDYLREVIRYQKARPEWTPHWEAETYTWNVLPDQLRRDIDEQIAGELAWLGREFRG